MSATLLPEADQFADEHRGVSTVVQTEPLNSSGVDLRQRWLFVAGTLVIALIVDGLLQPFNALRADFFAQPFLAGAALLQWKVGLVLPVMLALLIRGRRDSGWESIGAPMLRGLAVGLCSIMAWSYSTYSENLFAGQLHLADRLLLLALVYAVARHPLWFGPFLWQLMLILGQFQHPVSCSLTDKRLVIEAISVLYAAGLMNLFARRVFPSKQDVRVTDRSGDILTVVLCLFGTFYAKPGIGKTALQWWNYEHLDNLFRGAVYQNGWWGGCSMETISGTARVMEQQSLAMVALTLVLECGALLLLFRYSWAVALLCGCVALHVGIFISSGIFFWKWILADALLLAVLWRLPQADRSRVFGIVPGVLGLVAMLLIMSTFSRIPRLAWYDSSLYTRFHIEVEGESGSRYQVTPAMLSPFDIPFAQGRLSFLSPAPALVDCFGGVSDRETLLKIEQAASVADIHRIQAAHEPSRVDARKADGIERLLRAVVLNRQTAGEPGPLATLRWLRPPQHIWSNVHRDIDQPPYLGQEPAKRIVIRRQESLYREDAWQPVRDEVVREIDLTRAETR